MNEWTVSKDELLAATDMMSLVSSQPGVPSSEFFRITRDGSTCTFYLSSIVSGTVEVKGKGKFPFKVFYLDRKVFLPFVTASKELKNEFPFVFRQKGKHLLVTNGKRKALFNASAKVMGYTFQPKEKLMSKVVLDLNTRKLICCAKDCSPNDTVTPVLNCVYIQKDGKGLGVYATNTTVMFRGHANTKIKHKIPLPLGLVPLLGSDLLQEIHWREKLVELNFNSGSIWQPVSSKAQKKFPVSSIEKAMTKAQSYPVLFKVRSKKFGVVIARLGMYLGAVRRQDWILQLIGKEGKREIKLISNVPGSSFKETVQAETPAKKDFDFVWPLSDLLPVFEFIGADKKHAIEVRQDKGGGISYVSTANVQVCIARKMQ